MKIFYYGNDCKLNDFKSSSLDFVFWCYISGQANTGFAQQQNHGYYDAVVFLCADVGFAHDIFSLLFGLRE